MRKAEIERVFETYNVVLFGGRIELPDIMVRRMEDQARWYEPEDDTCFTRGLLVMSSSAHHSMTWRATLLHECIHMAIPMDENDHHGPLFLAECNRVGAIIGLEPCEPEDAWQWPSHHLNLVENEPNILEDVRADDTPEPGLHRPRKRRRRRAR